MLALSPFLMLAKGDISGTVVNKQTGAPMDFVTVQLLDAKGNPLTVGAETDEKGHFTLPAVADGKYLVKITCVGSVPQERHVTVAGADASVGTIRLADDAKILKEVVVEGVRSQMRFELDKKVFQVDANIAAAGTSASELLESIPSVEVDQDGEVSLRGSESVTVWINGKESGLTADNRAQILEQIPAETIDRVEVITNPSAKYSPEGTSGILNIILKQNRRAGYFGSAEVGGNSRGSANANFNINVNAGKWDSYASVGWRMRHNTNGDLSRRTYDNGYFLNSDRDSRRHGNNVFVRAGTTFHATRNDDIYLNAFGMFGHRWGRGTTTYLSDLPGQWTSNESNTHNKSDNRGAHAELGYTHRWNDTDNLDMMVSYNHWGGPSWTGNHERQVFDETEDNTNFQDQYQHINVNSIEAKVDYTNVLTSWLKLETGFNGNYSHENSPVSVYSGDTPTAIEYKPKRFNRFIYGNNISALYVTLGGKWRSLSFSAGLRSESWQVRTKSLAHGQSKGDVDYYKKNSFALFPSAFLSYSLPHDNELQINYTRRIRRPWGGQLNSFRDISDPNNIRYGNPELRPEYSNAFELNYIKSWTQHMISVSAYYRSTSDVMDRISYIDAKNVMYTTSANVTSQHNLGVEIVGKNNLFRDILSLTTTVNLYNNHINAWRYSLISPEDGKQYDLSGNARNSFAWDARIMASVKIPWQLSFQATGRYNSKMQTAQGTRQGGWSVDLGLRKNLGNWSFSLSCRDIFDSRKWRSTINGADYSQYEEHWHAGRTVRLSIKYSFGNMKARRDAAKNSAEPMDTSGYGEEM